MAYICSSPENYSGQKVGNGQCVVFVQHCTNAPNTALWKKGKKVRGDLLLVNGTAIATFDENGKYPNKPTGNHAAIYVGQDTVGIWVFDQWVRQGAVKKRRIRFKGGVGDPVDDGDAYFVID
jgi:hypothetical protein